MDKPEKKTSGFSVWFTKTFDTTVKRVWAIVIPALVAVGLLMLLISAVMSGLQNGKVVFYEDFENYSSSGYAFDSYTDNITAFSVPAKGEGVGGSSALKITSSDDNDARLTKKIELTGGRYYRIDADVKVSGITAENTDRIKGANISILESKDSSFACVNGGDGWVHITDYFTLAKSGSYTLSMRLGFYSNSTSGTAWFDNVKITTVSGAPAGVNVVKINTASSKSDTKGATYTESLYENMRFASWLILAIAFIILLVYGLFIRSYDKLGYEYIPANAKTRFIPLRYNTEGKGPLATLGRPLATIITVFLIALIVRLVLTVTYYECSIDVGLFKYWGRVATENGIGQLYKVATNCDYPPLYAYFLAAVTDIGNFLGLGTKGMTLMIKLPSILADLGIGLVIYGTAIKKRYSFGNAVFFASVWLFNPIVLLDSACWGQVDSILALFVVLCCIALNGKRYFAAGLYFGLGLMLKPQMFVFLPVAGCVFIADFIISVVKGKPKTAFGYLGKVIGGGLTGLIVPCIPFFGMGMENVSLLGKTVRLPWMFSLFLGTIDHYKYATVNNYNFWFLLGKNWVSDDAKIGPFSIYTVAMLFIVLISILIVGFYVFKTVKAVKNAVEAKRSGTEYKERAFHPGFVFLAGAVLYAMVPCFGPRMHERYFFPAILCLLMAAICYHRKGLLGAYGFMSGIGFITVHEVMMGLLVGGSINSAGGSQSAYADYYWPKLNDYRGLLVFITVTAALLTTGVFIANKLLERKEFANELEEPVRVKRKKKVKVRFFGEEASYLYDEEAESSETTVDNPDKN